MLQPPPYSPHSPRPLTLPRYLDVVGDASKANASLGLVLEYDYYKEYQQWSLDAVNGTLRNEGGSCADSPYRLACTSDQIRLKDTDNCVKPGDPTPTNAIVVNSCVNDFLREADQELNIGQIWKFQEETGKLVNNNGFCLGFYSPPIQAYRDVEEVDGENVHYCGALYPLYNGDPSQCNGNNAAAKCCNTKYFDWGFSSSEGVGDYGSKCGSGANYCDCEECIDYSSPENGGVGQQPLSNIPLVAATCSAPNALVFQLPDKRSVQQRLHSWCNDYQNCRYANTTEMTAQFDFGWAKSRGDNDMRWRCYDTTIMTTETRRDGSSYYR